MDNRANVEGIERSILSLCIDNIDIFNSVDKHLNKDLFSQRIHWEVYSSIRNYYSECKAYDKISLISDIAGSVDISPHHLDEIITAGGMEKNLDEYLKAIKNSALLHKLTNFSLECSSLITDETKKNPIALAEKMQQKLMEVTEIGVRKVDGDVSSALAEIMNDLDNPEHVAAYPTGFKRLDEIIGGLRRGAIMTVAADTGGGKTCFALNVASHCVLKQKKRVMIISLEMTRKALVHRLLSANSQVPLWKMEQGKLTSQEMQRLTHSVGSYAKHNDDLIIHQEPYTTIDDIKSQLRYYSIREPIDVLVIDYLQLISVEGSHDSYERITKVSRQVKEIAMAFNMPIILVSQFNRQKHLRAKDDQQPKLSDLKGSGNIEQDSDVVVFLHAEKGEFKEQSVQCIVAKNRYGRQGSFYFPFVGELSLFKNTI